MSIEQQQFRISLSGATMGTRYSAVFYSPEAKGHEPIGVALHAAVSDVDTVMSTWKVDSAISRLNRARPEEWIEIPPSLMDVLAAALAIEQQSNGAFDIGVGREVAAWGFGSGASEQTYPVIGPRFATRSHLELDQSNLRVRKHGHLALDLSGIAKGYGVDCLAETLLDYGVSDWLVGIDGEMRGKGAKPDGQAWAVGLEKPVRGHREVESAIELMDLAIATSGTYRHCHEMNGRLVSHTIDPATSEPVKGQLASVSVLAATCMAADAWATAILVDGHWPPEWFPAPPGIEAIILNRPDFTGG